MPKIKIYLLVIFLIVGTCFLAYQVKADLAPLPNGPGQKVVTPTNTPPGLSNQPVLPTAKDSPLVYLAIGGGVVGVGAISVYVLNIIRKKII